MRREPRWLTAEAVLAIHAALLATFGGRGGLRDRGLLESALAAPRHRYAYGERDIIVLAGHYAHALARNHAFVDGNKRIALLVLYVFLRLNGLRFAASEADAARVMQELAAGVSGVESKPRKYGVIDARVWVSDAQQSLQAPLLSARAVYPALRGVILFRAEPFAVLPASVTSTADELTAGVGELLGGWDAAPQLPTPLRPATDPLRASIKALRDAPGVKRAIALGEDDLLAVVLDLDEETTLAQLQSAALSAGAMLRPASLEPVPRAATDAPPPIPFWLAAHPDLRENSAPTTP